MYLLPQPEKVVWQNGSFRLRYNTEIIVDTAIPAENAALAYEYAKLLQKEISEDVGFTLPIRRESGKTGDGKTGKGNILLTNVSGKTAAEEEQIAFGQESSSQEANNQEANDRKANDREAYSLYIREQGIVIGANAAAGLLYGVQTLRQILRQAGAVLPCAQIDDAPKLSHRGLSYDVTRGRIPTLEELKRQADLCSFYKMNQLQLYVEHSYMFRDFSEVWRNNTPLTAEEILELDAYCQKLQLELVPSLASFGHMYEVLSTKTYGHLCELDGTENGEYSLIGRMAHHTVDVSNEESFAMVTGRIEEFMALFSSRYFNICADETFDLCKGKSKALGEEKGVKTVYLDFLKRLCDFVIQKGRIPMFWGDVLLEKPELLPEIPEDAVCLNWEYWPQVTEDKVKLLKDAGVQKLFLCPGVQSWNHLINRQSDAYQNIFLMCRNAHKYHAQGVLNTEWGDLGHIAHPEFSTMGQIYGAAFSWSDVPMEEEEINRAISRLQYGDASEEIAGLFRDLADTECANWWHVVQYKEERRLKPEDRKLESIIPAEKTGEVAAQLQRNREVLDRLYEKLPEIPESRREDVCAYILMGEGQLLLSMTGRAVCQRDAGQQVTYDTRALAVQLECWLMEYKKLWRSAAKESELFRIVEVISWYADLLREM